MNSRGSSLQYIVSEDRDKRAARGEGAEEDGKRERERIRGHSNLYHVWF